jgi:hypothetical protein
VSSTLPKEVNKLSIVEGKTNIGNLNFSDFDVSDSFRSVSS